MDFDFTDDQEQLRDAVRRWVDKGFAFERRHELAKAGGHTRALLGELTELGLLGLHLGSTTRVGQGSRRVAPRSGRTRPSAKLARCSSHRR